MEETLNRILQHQKLTYELLAAMYGDEPIREDETAVLLYTELKAPSQSIWSGPRRQSR